MSAIVVIDEVLLKFRIPKRLPDRKAQAVLRALMSPKFMRSLRSAVRSIVNKQSDLGPVTVAMSR